MFMSKVDWNMSACTGYDRFPALKLEFVAFNCKCSLPNLFSWPFSDPPGKCSIRIYFYHWSNTAPVRHMNIHSTTVQSSRQACHTVQQAYSG